MTVENNLENKAKFMFQYFGQEYYYKNDFGTYKAVIGDFHSSSHISTNSSCVLPLTPLSKISDEDAIEVAKIFNSYNSNLYTLEGLEEEQSIDGREFLKNIEDGYEGDADSILEMYDYLRSKGYALPWMGISVEQQIEFGWIRLK